MSRRLLKPGVFLVCLLPLALSSNRYMVKRLGKSWKTLHRLAYVAPVLGVVHFWWLVKADVLEPLLHALVLALLLAFRLPAWHRPGADGSSAVKAVSAPAKHSG